MNPDERTRQAARMIMLRGLAAHSPELSDMLAEHDASEARIRRLADHMGSPMSTDPRTEKEQ